MEKTKKITLFGILSLFSLIVLRATDYYGATVGAAPLNRILQFAGPMVLFSFMLPAMLPDNKYFKNILFTGIAYILWNIFYFVFQNGFTLENAFRSFVFAMQTKYMYIAMVALQMLVIMPVIRWIYKRVPVALITFTLIWTLFFQYSYITGTIIYYRVGIFPYMKVFFHMWLVYPVMCMLIADKFEKIVSNKKMLYISVAGFIVSEAVVYMESVIKDWGWTFVRPSVIFLSFFAAIILCYLVNYLAGFKIVEKIINALERSFSQMYFSFCLFLMLVNAVVKYRGGILGFAAITIAAIILTFGYGIIVTKIKNWLHPVNKTHTPPSEADQ